MNSPYTDAERTRSLAAVMVHMLGIGLTLGLTFPLTALTMARWGSPDWVIGLAGAMSPLAILLFMPVLPGVVARLGAVRSMVLGCGIAMIALGAMYRVPNVPAWVAARLVIGAGLALPWLAGDVWVNSVADQSSRGRVIGLYVTCLFAGFATGPLLLERIGIGGPGPHVLACAALALSVVPLVLVRRLAPPIEAGGGGSVLTAVRAAPVVAAGGLVTGFTEGAAFSLLPVWGLKTGLAQTGALMLMSVFIVGGIALQIVSGAAADRLGRQRLLALIGGALASVAVLLHLVTGPAVFALAFVAGGAVLAVYGLSLTLLGERFAPERLAMASAAYLILYQLGSMTGPLVAGAAMQSFGSIGFVTALGVAGGFVAVVAIAVPRQCTRPAST